MNRILKHGYLGFTLLSALSAWTANPTYAQGPQSDHADPRAQKVFDYWTAQRMQQAVPRDLVIDQRGLGFIKTKDGRLLPYGHPIEALPQDQSTATPTGKPSGGSSDTTPPTINSMQPAAGSTIGASATFSAVITDPSGIKSVTFYVRRSGGISQSFSPVYQDNDSWSITLQGFSDGAWEWWAVAKDNAGRTGNTATSATVSFTVDLGAGGGSSSGGDGLITNAHWETPSPIKSAAGRLYFEMPANKSWKTWNGYVCSGTVATDGTDGRSIIVTAAHCAYDDVNKAFARNVLFIPNQDSTTGNGTDLNCNNDPIGCWAPAFAAVDTDWTNQTFPANIPWDYAYYVVSDSGAHNGSGGDMLDDAAGNLPLDFVGRQVGVSTHAFGYSYSDDPNFMYCAEGLAVENSYSDWWLSQCGLSGGASGGPWIQPLDTASNSGPIISVNSWGYTNSPGMAGPKLAGTTAECLFGQAQSARLDIGNQRQGQQGIIGCNAP